MSYDPRKFGAQCDMCPLKGSVPVPAETNPGASICLVGEAPGSDEVREGRPFVGASGQEMQRALNSARLQRRDLHITNVMLCQPPKNELSNLLAKISSENRERTKRNQQKKKQYELLARHQPWLEEPQYEALVPSPVECCSPRLKNEVQRFTQFITLGGTAARVIMNTTMNILGLRGGMSELDAGYGLPARRVLPTLHPSFVIRAPRWSHVFRNDLHRAQRWFRGGLNWVSPNITYHPTAEWLEAFLNRSDVPYWTYDLETDGIEPLTAKIRCVGIGAHDGQVALVGLLSKDGITRFYTEAEERRVVEVMKRFFVDPNKIKVGHNSGSYDSNCLNAQWGIWPEPALDTIMLHRLVESELPHGLGFVGSLYTDAPSWKTDREGRKLAFDAESDEQLHEYCLFEGTQVLTEVGLMGIEEIVRQKWAGKVLSKSGTGALEWRTVTGWHYNLDKNTSWVRVEVEGQREKERGLICTPDHRLIGPAGEVEAQALQPGDHIFDAEEALTEDELQAILGTVMGDSSLVTSPTFRKSPHDASTASLVGGHAVSSGFASWKVAELPLLALDPVLPSKDVIINGRSGTSGPFQRYRSRSMRQLADALRLTYDTAGKRRMSKETLDRMGLRGLAWLLVDDGCVQKYSRPEPQNTGERGGRIYRDETIAIAAQGFPREDIDAAVAWFSEKFGATSAGKDGVIRLGTVASRNFALAVVPYVPKEARYKLPRLRDYPSYRRRAYVPVRRNKEPQPSLRRVVSVTAYVHPAKFRTQQYIQQRRYCIDVEKNHNFFTTYGLVHNCGMDVAVTSRVVPPLFDAVKVRGQTELIAMDHRIQKICAEMHLAGMWVDQEKRLYFEKKYITEVGKRLEDLRLSAPTSDFNPGSPHQIRKILFDQWGLVSPLDERDRYTASGDAATSDDVLRSLLTLQHLTDEQRNFVLKLRRYRKAQKLLGTYVVKLRPSTMQAELGWDDDEDFEDAELRKKYGIDRTGIVDPRTGRMHPGYNAHVAVTGRLSSSKPINAQNFPKGLRAMVTAAPGNVLIGADADQLELRIAAALWGAKRYLRAFDVNADPHSSTALACFGERFRKATGFPGGKWDGDLFIPDGTGKWSGEAKTFRDLAKRVQYASQYMATVETVHRVICQTETDNGDGTTSLPYLHLTLREVREMHQAWLDGCPEFPMGWEREIGEWRKQNYLMEPITGRRRDFLDGENPNELVNFKIQGGAAGLMNKAIIELADRVPVFKWGRGTGIINQCHDALVLEVPADGAELRKKNNPETGKEESFWHVPEGSIPWKVMQDLNECMNQVHPALPGVRITAAADIGLSWKEVG